MNLKTLKAYWKKGWFSFLICSGALFYLLNFTWLKWGDLIIDTGRETYVPLQLTLGKLLYRDILYFYGPFSPYFNAFLFKVFGPNLNTLILSGIITTGLCSILIYKITRFLVNVITAILVVMTFLFAFAFAHYYRAGIFNFILPYTYSATYGTLLSLSALYFFYLWLKTKSKLYSYGCFLFLTLGLLCKIEIGVAILLALSIGLGAYFFKNRMSFNKKDIIKNLLIFIIGPIFFYFIVSYIFFILSKGNLDKGYLSQVYFINMTRNNLFSKNLFGGNNILESLLVIAKVFLYYLFLCGFFILGGFIINKAHKYKRVFIAWAVYFCTAFISLSITYIFVKRFFAYDLQYRILPLISFIMAIVFLPGSLKIKKTRNIFLSARFPYFLFS